MLVAGGAGHFHVELEVRRHRVGVLFDGALKGVERRLHGRQMGVRAALRCQAGGLGLQADAQFQHRDHVGHGGEILAARSGNCRRARCALTKVPMPWRVSTSPEACRRDKASRTTVRLTSKRAMISASVGSLPPTGKRAGTDLAFQRSDDLGHQSARAPACGGGFRCLCLLAVRRGH